MLGTTIPVAVVSILTSNPCLAQIIPDTMLGNESSRITTGVNIKEHGADLIEGGVQRGSNLFHSFAEFNVNNGQRVYFANPTGIADIFSRVTGGNASNILGTLGVNGAANLFLLNPKGIIFGPNAQLDIQGSFLATTANSFQFPDGSKFSATNPQAPPLLTMSVPVGVQYGLQQTASITNQGNLVAGKDLTLNAGNLDLQGQLQAGGNLTLQAQETLKVRDSATNPFIAAAGGNLLAQGNQKVDISALNHPDSGFYSGGDMVLQSENTIGGDAHFWAGGNFRIEKLNGNLGNLFSPDDPVIRATGNVSFGSYTGASLHILAGGSVNISGNVDITGVDSTSNSLQETVTLSDGTTIDIDGSNKPTLDIRAGVDSNYIGTPQFTPNPLIGFNVQNPNTSNEPTNANINIQGKIYNLSGSQSNSGDILITNQYHPNGLAGDITTGVISTYGNVAVDSQGDITNNGTILTDIYDFVEKNRTGGSIKLLANQNILIQGSLLSNVNGSLNGNGGNIYLNSRNGTIDIKADIISKSPNNGIAGSVTIQALGNISLSNSKIEAISNNDIEEYKNNITINSTKGSLNLNDSQLNTTNNNDEGYAGYIIINASDKISLLNGSKISSQGNNGLLLIGINLTIPTDDNSETIKLAVDPNNTYTPKNVFIDNKSEINTNGNDSDEAGGIIINASDKISLLNGSKILSQGNNGLLLIGTPIINQKVLDNNGLQFSGINDIDKPNSIIIDNSEINTNSHGSSKAGNISINASNKISILNESKIFSQGNFGSIDITAGSLYLNHNSEVNTNNDSGSAGDINITTNNLLLRRHSKISTTAGQEGIGGNGGSIKINANDGFVIAKPSEDSDIIANAFGGQGGKIKITASRILGFQNRGKLNSAELRKIKNNGTSDISASSDVDSGEVVIESLSIDPSQGLVALPTNLVDPSRLIAQGCTSSNSNVAKGQSEFVITGRGGLPPSPDDTLKPAATLPEWVVNNTVNNSNNSINMTENNLRQLSSNISTPLVEAVGMVRSANGDIVLTAQSTTATLLQSGLSTQACNVTQGNVR
ncbi:filamentous hemagglutinin N-terminal domain-containing protein [Nostoc sp. DedVER01b]|uniref:two-partner secretion domain-containing protein n=1 Tax=Nostoc sp. DedVER01b TaxID=3075404 RepID=UPI003D160625